MFRQCSIPMEAIAQFYWDIENTLENNFMYLRPKIYNSISLIISTKSYFQFKNFAMNR